jgi:hypothetical protein
MRTLAALFNPDDVVELRGFQGRKIVSGYFDDHEALAAAADALDQRHYNCYITPNSVDPPLLARSPNTVAEQPKATTADRDIIRRQWLLLDFDPVRPSGVSATHDEKTAAYARAKEVRAYLRAQGWLEPVIADSGNGFHFHYRVELPNDRESRELAKGVLEALAFRFDDDRVKIDTSVHNAARIIRLYGTMNRKADHTSERPHRRSEILKVPKEVV